MPGTNEYLLTLEGKENYEKEYRHLLDVERPDVVEQLAAARAMGDLSENADFDAAKKRIDEIDIRIAEIENILNNCKIIESNSKKKSKIINISNVVKYVELDDAATEYTVKIVSSIESDPITDPNNIKISNVCPLGQALIGKKVGDVVKVQGVKPYEVKIIEIK